MTQRLHGNEIQAGDTVTFTSGKSVQVISTRPYEGPLLELLGAGTQDALVWMNGQQVGMILDAVSRFGVERVA